MKTLHLLGVLGIVSCSAGEDGSGSPARDASSDTSANASSGGVTLGSGDVAATSGGTASSGGGTNSGTGGANNPAGGAGGQNSGKPADAGGKTDSGKSDVAKPDGGKPDFGEECKVAADCRLVSDCCGLCIGIPKDDLALSCLLPCSELSRDGCAERGSETAQCINGNCSAQVDCEQSPVMCDMIMNCPDGLVPTVIGDCFGRLCVEPVQCAED